MNSEGFEPLADYFEALVNWQRRLENESPLFRRYFDAVGAGRVLDAACGTGHHAAMFHSLGLEVEAADISPAMISAARARFGEPPGLRWVVRSYDQPRLGDDRFDIAVCIGNSLALADDVQTVEAAVRQMLTVLRPRGLLILHVLNLWALPDGPCVWQKSVTTEIRGQPTLLVKGVHRCGNRGRVELIRVSPDGAAPLQATSVPFLGLEPEVIERIAKEEGATAIELFGDYRSAPYQRQSSADLIIVITK